ncbi:reverse transcriptase domain-containing protein [Dyella sp. S184]|uniref:reverse transcriptase domain-containing protein n=1 Tax=Dyella sp. S184 TaxID=1641862 RepID=UPI00131C6C82|nr:reverse transcriptase domain-containing protein [Dyella sp. S184]
MLDLLDICSSALGTTRENALVIARTAPYRLKRIEIPKQDGSKRITWQAAIETKGLHYPLIQYYLRQLPAHPASQAFSPGSSIIKNAGIHLGNKYFLRIDFSDFFPSIKFNSFKKIINQTKSIFENFNTATPESMLLLEKACFAKDSSLPIGYATSPYIANCTMFEFDREIIDLLRAKFASANVTYTRYADDLVFSTNIKNACRDIYDVIVQFVKKYRAIDLTINHKKTHFGSVPKGTAYVTGVHMLESNRTAATKTLRSEARFLLSLRKKNKLDDDEQKRLFGLLAHIRQIDPAFYTKLASDFHVAFPHTK